MKNKLQFSILLLFSALLCGAFSTDTKKFFASGADPARKLPADKIFPEGKLFPISRSAKPNGKDNIKISKTKGKFRHDIYSALISGSKKIRVISSADNEDYKKLQQELNGKKKIGQLFLFGKAKKDLTLKILDGPGKSVKMKSISYKNSRYVFLVNSSSKIVELIVGGLVYGSGVTVQDVFLPEEKFTAPEGDFEVEIKPLEVKVFKIYNKRNH